MPLANNSHVILFESSGFHVFYKCLELSEAESKTCDF